MSDISKSSANWNNNIEILLNDIRLNANTLEEHHRALYFSIKANVIYFKLPIIFLSSINAISAVAFSNYIDQSYISMTNCGISFIIGLLTSISLYLKIEDRLDSEMSSCKEYHKLGIEIYKMLSLKPSDRTMDGDIFLNEMYSEYVKLFERSNLLRIDFSDKLKKVDIFGATDLEHGMN